MTGSESTDRGAADRSDRIGDARLRDSYLRAAAARVLARWSAEQGDAGSPQAVADDLDRLVAAAEAGVEGLSPPPADAAGFAIRRRLLEMVHAEMLRGWREQPEAPDAAEMLEALEALERARARLAPAPQEETLADLADSNGLGLVLEVAHDLRSPLTSILFLSETLRRGQSGALNEIQRRQLGIIYSAALGLASTANAMVDMAKGGERLAQGEPVPFSITELFESVRGIVQPMAEEKQLELRCHVAGHDRRLGFAAALNRVLLNLTTNALKFTDEGHIAIHARETGRTRVEFSVRDTGRGIAPEELGSLYQAFRWAPERKGYRFSGSGLGLTICRRLTAAMGSQLQVETRPGWGTRFAFELELPPARLQ